MDEVHKEAALTDAQKQTDREARDEKWAGDAAAKQEEEDWELERASAEREEDRQRREEEKALQKAVTITEKEVRQASLEAERNGNLKWQSIGV
ncbi:hypothetical protein HYDPIDRAFT_35141 [Hydnomerulius pinastri MD-312]|uniref:Uncharacterized protein n=1 Tax=Hydnomerulius pinastri MD-312 TaxID=994086 RepID=A0A0C2KJ75_9AGAM|nr:hypothetical protein HYDPIDRAFT_35141 [Hydnomerulius pinastri MD-312]